MNRPAFIQRGFDEQCVGVPAAFYLPWRHRDRINGRLGTM